MPSVPFGSLGQVLRVAEKLEVRFLLLGEAPVSDAVLALAVLGQKPDSIVDVVWGLVVASDQLP